MTPADQLAHFSGSTDNLAMSGLWYSHKRVTELIQAARAQAWADMAATLNDRADMLEQEGNRRCEVRECRMLANAYRTYAEGVGVPSMDSLRRKRREAEARVGAVQDLVNDERRHLVRWIDGSHLVDVSDVVAALAVAAHDCSKCTDCIHNGAKCCGCYDGACCQDWGGA